MKPNPIESQASSETREPTSPPGSGVTWMRGTIIVTFATIAAAAVATMIGGDRAKASSDAPLESSPENLSRRQSVEVIRIEEVEGIETTEVFLGRVEAARSSALGFEVGGTLIRVLVNEGEAVRTGQLIAELDTDRLDASLAEMEALVKQAEAAVDLTETTWDRMRQLVAKKSVSQQDVDNATERKLVAAAALNRAQSQREAIRVDLAKSRLHAPFAGTISERLADEGTMLGQGQAVLRLLETEHLEVRAGLPSSVARRLGPGDRLSLQLREHANEDSIVIKGEVVRILPVRDSRLQTVDVILAIESSEPVRDGDLVEIGVSRRIEARGFWLPRAAMTESSRGLWAVYAVGLPEIDGEGARLEVRQIEIIEQSGDLVLARGALSTGDEIVISGRQRLTPGLLVEPILVSQGNLLTRN